MYSWFLWGKNIPSLCYPVEMWGFIIPSQRFTHQRSCFQRRGLRGDLILNSAAQAGTAPSSSALQVVKHQPSSQSAAERFSQEITIITFFFFFWSEMGVWKWHSTADEACEGEKNLPKANFSLCIPVSSWNNNWEHLVRSLILSFLLFPTLHQGLPQPLLSHTGSTDEINTFP